jgi:hypothetical protein
MQCPLARIVHLPGADRVVTTKAALEADGCSTVVQGVDDFARTGAFLIRSAPMRAHCASWPGKMPGMRIFAEVDFVRLLLWTPCLGGFPPHRRALNIRSSAVAAARAKRQEWF